MEDKTEQEYLSIYKWAIIENIVIILVVAGLFILTESGWVFLLLLLINSFKKSKAKRIGGEKV